MMSPQLRKKVAAGCLILCVLSVYRAYRVYKFYENEVAILKLLTMHPEVLAGQPENKESATEEANVKLPPLPAAIYVWSTLAVLAAIGAVVVMRVGKEPSAPTTLGLGRQ